MERVTFLIERSGARVTCLLNPESLEARRQAGLARRRHAGGGVLGNPRSDDPLVSTGGGITEYDLQLLFDVEVANEGRALHAAAPPLQSLAEPAASVAELPVVEPTSAEDVPESEPVEPTASDPVEEPPPDPAPADPVALDEPTDPPVAADPAPEPVPEPAAQTLPVPPPAPPGVVDVRELTQPLWALAETGAPVDGALAPQRVRFIWGKSWNVPAVVLAVAERLEQFDANGVPQRSWLALRLRRVEEQAEGGAPPPREPTTPQFQIDQPGAGTGGETGEEAITLPVYPDGYAAVRHDQVGAEYYGDPALGRAVYEYNEIDDLLRADEGQRLRLPPRSALAEAA